MPSPTVIGSATALNSTSVEITTTVAVAVDQTLLVAVGNTDDPLIRATDSVGNSYDQWGNQTNGVFTTTLLQVHSASQVEMPIGTVITLDFGFTPTHVDSVAVAILAAYAQPVESNDECGSDASQSASNPVPYTNFKAEPSSNYNQVFALLITSPSSTALDSVTSGWSEVFSGTFSSSLAFNVYYEYFAATGNYPLVFTFAGNVSYCCQANAIALASAPFTPIVEVGQVIQVGCAQILVTSIDSTTATYSGTVVGDLGNTIPNDPTGAVYPIPAGEWSVGTPTSTFPGMEYLAGKSVMAVVDGSPQGPFIVPDDGEIELNAPGLNIIVGLSYTCQLQTLRLELEGVPTLQGRRKIIPAIDMIVKDTAGLEVGTRDFQDMYPYPDLALPYSVPCPPLRSGVFHVPTGDGWNVEGQICFQQNWPLPASILGVVFETTIGDDAE